MSEREHYNRSGFLAFSFSMAFSVALIIYLVVIQEGVDLKENVIDPQVKQASGQEEFNIDKVAEPWVTSEQLVAYGQKKFKMDCAMCHGNEGKGDGPAGAALNPKPRNIVEGKWNRGNGVINHYKLLTTGSPGTSMGAYAHFKSAERWALIHFIESVTTNKSKDDLKAVAEFAKSAK